MFLLVIRASQTPASLLTLCWFWQVTAMLYKFLETYRMLKTTWGERKKKKVCCYCNYRGLKLSIKQYFILDQSVNLKNILSHAIWSKKIKKKSPNPTTTKNHPKTTTKTQTTQSRTLVTVYLRQRAGEVSSTLRWPERLVLFIKKSVFPIAWRQFPGFFWHCRAPFFSLAVIP